MGGQRQRGKTTGVSLADDQDVTRGNCDLGLSVTGGARGREGRTRGVRERMNVVSAKAQQRLLLMCGSGARGVVVVKGWEEEEVACG